MQQSWYGKGCIPDGSSGITSGEESNVSQLLRRRTEQAREAQKVVAGARWEERGDRTLAAQLAAYRHQLASRASGTETLTCPRCRLSVVPRWAALAPRHCPRCLARYRVAVELQRTPAGSATDGAPTEPQLGAAERVLGTRP